MPDKQKKRKNNKNKRKNRNNNWSKNNKNCDSVANEVENEKCSEVTAEESVCAIKDNILEQICETNNTDTSNVCVVDEFLLVAVNNAGDAFTEKGNNTTNTSNESCINQESLSDISSSTLSTNAKNDNLDVNQILPSKSNNSSSKELREILANVPDNPSPEQNYVVESPDQTLECKPKNVIKFQSKSLDNEDEPKIIEITDDDVAISADENPASISTSSVVVTDIEWETTNNLQQTTTKPVLSDLASSKFSLTCTPILTVAQCQQSSSLTPEEELSLRAYLDTLNLATHPPNSAEIKAEIEEIIKREVRQRLRKKAHTDDIISPRLGPARQLDVIAEEGSGESSLASRRQSYLSEIQNDLDDLDDDVFLDSKPKRKDDCMPPKPRKINNKPALRQIPQKCVLVDTQIKEPELTEARGDWSVQTIDKIEGAEVVYLTDSSSSTSSVNEIAEEDNEDLDSDISVRMMTPTIEVTDTEKLLKKTFIKQDSEEAEIPSARDNDTKYVKTDSNDSMGENLAQNPNEIIVLTTDNIQTSLYVKDFADENYSNEPDKNLKSCERNHQSDTDNYNLEMKVLKCELNDAINNLIKEVVSDSENTNEREPLNRQDSSSSIGSSQCTAKYIPSSSSLNDVSNILHDDLHDTNKPSNTHLQSTRLSSHVKDVFECVTGTLPSSQENNEKDKKIYQPLPLRDVCLKKISTLPYGEKILEELASVSKRLQSYGVLGSNIATCFEEKKSDEAKHLESSNSKRQKPVEMPYYPLPDVSTIVKVSLPTNQKSPMPPPVRPRKSSLNKTHDDSHWTGLPTQQEPVYMCLSPSQKMLMEKTNTVISKEDATQLIDMHKKYVDRRGYSDKGKHNEKENSNNPPAIPFKSQTGSRLLAIIRDPAVTNNINSSINKHLYKSFDQLQRESVKAESTFKKSFEHFNAPKKTPPFKPIPPPRPRKFSSSIYESDESSDFTDSSLLSMKSEKKFFHYSTGALNEEIENDISSIQDMHRRYTNIRDSGDKPSSLRRPSLPKDLCEQQMEYIRQKEKEVEAEIKRLEEMKLNMADNVNKGPKSPVIQENKSINTNSFKSNQYSISRQMDFAVHRNKSPEKGEKAKVSSIFSNSQEEIMREKMYSEYMSQMAERQHRKEKKVIKITNNSTTNHSQSQSATISKSMSALDMLESKTNNPIEKEFIWKARERWDKLGIKDPETEDERDNNKDVYKEPQVIKHKIKVIQGDQETDVQKLPSHLQEFVQLTVKNKEKSTESPGESGSGPMNLHAVILCAVLVVVVAIVRFFYRLLKRK